MAAAGAVGVEAGSSRQIGLGAGGGLDDAAPGDAPSVAPAASAAGGAASLAAGGAGTGGASLAAGGGTGSGDLHLPASQMRSPLQSVSLVHWARLTWLTKKTDAAPNQVQTARPRMAKS